jgi:hypothetical protein
MCLKQLKLRLQFSVQSQAAHIAAYQSQAVYIATGQSQAMCIATDQSHAVGTEAGQKGGLKGRRCQECPVRRTCSCHDVTMPRCHGVTTMSRCHEVTMSQWRSPKRTQKSKHRGGLGERAGWGSRPTNAPCIPPTMWETIVSCGS